MSEDYDMQKNIYGDGSLHLKEIGDVCVFLLSYFFFFYVHTIWIESVYSALLIYIYIYMCNNAGSTSGR